ncbi:MAG: hypothetical protein V4439_04455 [Patescibacteria group bacterium]
MKTIKTLAVLSAFAILTSFVTPKGDSVYVCDSQTSVAYHVDKNCKGLSRCTHKIITVTKADAVNVYKKRACKICAQ